MRSVVVGVLVGGLVCLASLLLLGAVHRYVYGPALAQFGDAEFFTDMSTAGIFWLVIMRVFSAWLGSSIAVRMSNEPHGTWTGPIVVMTCALTTILILGMSQPIWSLILSLVLVFVVGWAVGRSHVGMPVIPGLDQLRARLGNRD
jgi:disulfide bond formation protein DsbB